MFSVRKGVLWLLLATIAEVPPTVGPIYITATFHSSQRNVTGIDFLESKWYRCFLSSIIMKGDETTLKITDALNLVRSCLEPCGGDSYALSQSIDVSATSDDHALNLCDSDVSLSDRLRI